MRKAGTFTKAAVVNAFTSFAHNKMSDPWAADAVSADATALLTRKAALPFEAEVE